MSSNLWWGYRHQLGTFQAKLFFDQRDIDEARESDFVVQAVGPFEAADRETALEIVKAKTA